MPDHFGTLCIKGLKSFKFRNGDSWNPRNVVTEETENKKNIEVT